MAEDQRVELTVDGRQVAAAAGTRLLDLLRKLGIRVPTLCDHPPLTPYGGCRLCVVSRRDGRGGLVPACSTPVLPGMVIETSSPEVVESRRHQLGLLVLNHRFDCPACDREGDCRLQELLYEYGVPDRRLPFARAKVAIDDRSPVIVRDAEKCILCSTCVRLCDEVQGVGAIALVHRGLNTRIATQLDRPLDCEFCGQCVTACPVGALVAQPHVCDVPVWLRHRVTTTCSFCSSGCQVEVESHEGTVVRVRAEPRAEPNQGKLCVKGWLGLDVIANPKRLRRPLLRREGQLVEASWDEALTAAADALRDARSRGERVAGLGSSRLPCEDAYLFQQLLRTTAQDAHVGIGPAGGVRALTDGMSVLTGTPRSTASFDDLRAADVVLVLRGDPGSTHPLVKTELVEGMRRRQQKIIMAHALSGSLARRATLPLPLRPGGEEALLNGIVNELRSGSGGSGESALDVPGFVEWQRSVLAYDPGTVERLSGVSPATMAQVCAVLSEARSVVTVVVTGLGIPGDEAAVTRAAVVLDAVLGERGAGVLVLGEKANLQGALEVGLHPAWRAGGYGLSDLRRQAAVSSDPPRAEVSQPPWHIADGNGNPPVGVMYLAGQDPAGAWPRGMDGGRIARNARVVIVHEAFLTQTARLADVVLPVAILAEREGTVVAADGVRRALRRVVPPPDGLPQDGDIFREIGRRLGIPLPGRDALEQEISAIVGRGPRPKAHLQRLVPVRPPAPVRPWSGLLLDASPQLFRSGSITEHSALLQELAPSVALRLSPSDAATFGLQSGDPVRVSANGREALLRARLDRTVRPGTVVAQWRARWDPAASLLIADGEPTRVEIRRPS